MSTHAQSLSLLTLLIASGCGEYSLQPLGKGSADDTATRSAGPGEPPGLADTGAPVLAPVAGPIPDVGFDIPEPVLPPEPEPEPDPGPDPDPPGDLLHGCDSPSATATWGDGEVWVSTTGSMTRRGNLDVSETGLFHIYSAYSAESGATQMNESAYYRIENDTAPDGLPLYGNCGDEWVVRDMDNDEPWAPGDYLYIGTFFLEEGDNDLELNHYCELFSAGECAEFHVDEDETSTCPSSNPNSAHFSGDVCLLAVDSDD